MTKIPVGILGATGMVGQQYISLLKDHPWFEPRFVAASPNSAGKKYKDATAGRVHFPGIIESVGELVVADASDISRAKDAAKAGNCTFVFSALEMEKEEICSLEDSYAAAGIPVVSNASAHRWTEDVPVLIAEVNHQHMDIIPAQRKARGWDKGFIVVKPKFVHLKIPTRLRGFRWSPMPRPIAGRKMCRCSLPR